MDDNQFTISCIKCIMGIVICAILTMGGCEMHADYRIAKVIEGGADPIAANLAFNDTIETKMVLYNLTKNK